jgi:hypothetical protein
MASDLLYPLFPMIQGTGCNLMIDVDTIPSKHHKHLHNVRGTVNIKTRISPEKIQLGPPVDGFC